MRDWVRVIEKEVAKVEGVGNGERDGYGSVKSLEKEHWVGVASGGGAGAPIWFLLAVSD